MTVTALGHPILIADQAGDRPAVVTKVFTATKVEACGFMPLPERLALVTIHPDRREAIKAGETNPTGYHAYKA